MQSMENQRDSLMESKRKSPVYTIQAPGVDSFVMTNEGEVPEKDENRKCFITLIILTIVGALMAAVGGIMFPVVDLYIKEQVKERVVISSSSETYEIWQDIPVPVYMQFYMFDIGNPEEVKIGKTPFLKEVGPFTYEERRVKFNIIWNDNGTVTYRQNRTFSFVPEMSIGDEDTKITTINPLIATIAQNFQFLNGFIKGILSVALSAVNEDIIFTRPVRELLWGYEDQALALMNTLNKAAFPTVNIGYFIRKNNTDDGLYTVNTGENDYHKLAFITEFNGADSVDIWTTPWANMVNGTDGTLGPPFRFDAQVSPVFVSDICRSIKGVYKKDVETPQGIKLRRFGGDRRDMENATLNPDNIGFCTPQSNCLPTGLLNSTLCQEPVDGFQLPVVFSFPHFLYADPAVLNSVVGLKPVEEEHQTVLDQEPWTGLVLQVAKRLQINMHVKKVSNIGQTHEIQDLFFPILWLNESSVVDDRWANKLKDDLFTPMHYAKIGKYGLVAFGGALFLAGVVMLFARRFIKAKVKDKPKGNKLSQSERDAAYDKPVVDDDRASVISRSTLEEGRFNGRNSVDTLDWYDPETYDGDGIPQTSQEEHPLVKPTL